MEERKRRDEDAPQTAESPEAEEMSERLPEEVSGEGATPLGSSDEHSDAPGETGTGSREPDPERGRPARR
jgi:hypothetical protein